MKQLPLFASICLLLLSLQSESQSLNFENIFVDTSDRVYAIYVPASYDGTEAFPVMFNFHGGGGTIASQILTSDMRPIADTANFFVVYPQALADPNDGGAFTWTHKPPTTHDDVNFVNAMIDDIGADYLIDTTRVYACGYSNGGEFCFDLACRLSDRVAAVTSVASTMYIEDFTDCTPAPPVAVQSIHGTLDFVRPYNGLTLFGITFYVSMNDQNLLWTTINNTDPIPAITAIPNTSMSDGSTVERYVWSNGIGCMEVEHLRVDGGGHDWPGTFGNMDIDSDVEIWNFASRFDLNGKIGCAAPSCNTSTAPDNLNTAISGSDIILSWDPISGSEGCQVQGTQISPPGPSGSAEILGTEVSSIDIPIAALAPGSVWEWEVRCACSLSPIDATSFSASSTFTVPILREDFSSDQIKLFPNPTSGWTQVQFNSKKDALIDLRILDIMGRVILQKQKQLTAGSNTIELDLTPFPAGQYIIEIIQDEIYDSASLHLN
jgi:polyhydroxybutyrate depolymerase